VSSFTDLRSQKNPEKAGDPYAAAFVLLCIVCNAALPLRASDPAAARRLAAAGDHKAALAAIELHLAAAPQDDDARTLRGTVLSWMGRLADARVELEGVVGRHPANRDALLALTNVELWAGNPRRAEELAEAGLKSDPADSALTAVRLRAQRAIRAAAAGMAGEDRAYPQRWEASVGHSSEWFSDGRTPWREDFATLKYEGRAATGVMTFSTASRFSGRGRQVQLDLYPRLRRGTYALLNAGYSPSAGLYPRYRSAVELYQGVGRSFEAVAGYRRLGFGSGVNTAVAGLSKYQGNWLLTGRAFLTPEAGAVSRSALFSVRRFSRTGTNSWTLRGAWGSSPTEVSSIADIDMLRTASLGGEYQRRLGTYLNFVLRAGLTRQERAGNTGLNRVLLEMNLYVRF
jgi:YaiO family outer membrane protein